VADTVCLTSPQRTTVVLRAIDGPAAHPVSSAATAVRAARAIRALRLGRFAELEDQQLGSRGFTDAVNQVAQTECSFDIEDLAGFTPQLS
jgi:hypothetical protein